MDHLPLGVRRWHPQMLEWMRFCSHLPTQPLICAINIPGSASWDTRPGAPNKTRARRLHHEK